MVLFHRFADRVILNRFDDIVILIRYNLQAVESVILVVSSLAVDIALRGHANRRLIGIRDHLRISRIEPQFVDIAGAGDADTRLTGDLMLEIAPPVYPITLDRIACDSSGDRIR